MNSDSSSNFLTTLRFNLFVTVIIMIGIFMSTFTYDNRFANYMNNFNKKSDMIMRNYTKP